MRKKFTQRQLKNCCFVTPNNIVDAITKKEISTSKRISPIISVDSIFEIIAEKLKDGLRKRLSYFTLKRKAF